MESPVLRAVWNGVKGKISGVTLGGIAPSSATASGYHNTRDRHLAGATTAGRNDYSVQTAADKAGNTGQYFCGLDLSGTAQTALMTKRLRDAVNRRDPRIACLREILGSLDNKSTIRYTHTSPGGAWSVGNKPDSSHLWHVHLSLFRQYANDTSVVKGLVDVLTGVAAPAPEPTEGALMALSNSEQDDLYKKVQATNERLFALINLLDEVNATWSTKGGKDSIPLSQVLRALRDRPVAQIDLGALAQEIVNRLPDTSGGLTKADVKSALTEVIKGGVG